MRRGSNGRFTDGRGMRFTPEQRLKHYAAGVAAAERGEGPLWLSDVIDCIREGMNPSEAAAELGLAKSSVYDYLRDPYGDGLRERKACYAHPCPKCGRMVNPNGLKRRVKRCQACIRDEAEARARPVVDRWNEGMPVWAICDELQMSENEVKGIIENARQRWGWHVELHRKRNRDGWEEIQRLAAEGKTAPEIGEAVGDTAHNIHAKIAAMRELGIDIRLYGPRPQWTDEQIIALRDRWNADENAFALGEAFGLKRSSLYGAVQRFRNEGWDFKSRQGNNR